MEVTFYHRLSKEQESLWREFLQKQNLIPGEVPETVFFLHDGTELIGTASLSGDLIQYFAVDPARRGEDLAAVLLTAVKNHAFQSGIERLTLLTKPENRRLFAGLLFEPVAETSSAIFMESAGGGTDDLLSNAPEVFGKVGSIVMNADPFTLGHRFLIETAAKECDFVFVFVLSEEKSFFSAEDRILMVKEGVSDLPNVFVLPTGRYLVSEATFPTYFLKDRQKVTEAFCDMDIAVFLEKFVPALSISVRYLGTEPFDPVTNAYNAALLKALPENGVAIRLVERKTAEGEPVSAKAVRRLLTQKEFVQAAALLPESTVSYLKSHSFFD